jgi:uncharacterized membrane protein HdeD (DUF308 family)
LTAGATSWLYRAATTKEHDDAVRNSDRRGSTLMAAGRRSSSWWSMANARDGAAVADGMLALGAALATWTGGALGVGAVLLLVVAGAGIVITLLWSTFAAVALLAAVASWAVAEELIEEMLEASGRRRRQGAWLTAVGVSALLFGTGLLLWPGTTSLALVWPIGGYAITCGTCAVAIALRQRGRVALSAR